MAVTNAELPLLDSAVLWQAGRLLAVQAAAYLAGSVPFGYLVARRAAGIDIRQHGSGNIGATNVGRTLGFRYFALVFALDFLKGLLPALAARWLQTRAALDGAVPASHWYLPEAAAFAAIVGHMFPMWLKFKGGKGVATTVGALAGLAFNPLLGGLAVFLAVLALTRMVSAASIAFAAGFNAAYFLDAVRPWRGEQLALSAVVVAVGVLVVVRHRTNLARIIAGTEARIGRRPPR